MSAEFKLHLKIFFWTGFLFTAVIEGVDILRGEIDFTNLLFNFFWFGLLMSLTLVHLQVSSLRDLGVQEFTKENLSPIQRSDLITKMDLDTIKNHIEANDHFLKASTKIFENTLLIDTAVSWLSMGERISITETFSEPGKISYQIESKPKIPFTMVDYGKNLRNVIELENLFA